MNTTCTQFSFEFLHSIYSNADMKMLVKCLYSTTHAYASRICGQRHNCKDTYNIRTQPANTNHKVCLEFTYLDMKHFLFVIIQVEVVKTTQCTTFNFLCSRQYVQTWALTPTLQTIESTKYIATNFV